MSHGSLFTRPPAPEPGTYALMLAGLAAVGFVARGGNGPAAADTVRHAGSNARLRLDVGRRP